MSAASRRQLLAGFAALSALAAAPAISAPSTAAGPRTALERRAIQAFRKLTPEMQEAFITMLRDVKAGVPMRDAGISFWTAGGWTREEAEEAVDGLLAGTSFDAGTGSA